MLVNKRLSLDPNIITI